MDNLLVVAASLRQTHSNLIDLIRVYLTVVFFMAYLLAKHKIELLVSVTIRSVLEVSVLE